MALQPWETEDDRVFRRKGRNEKEQYFLMISYAERELDVPFDPR